MSPIFQLDTIFDRHRSFFCKNYYWKIRSPCLMKWPCILKVFGFHFKLQYFFSLKNTLVYVDKFQGILKTKESSMKCKIPRWVFNVVCIFQKYGKYWNVLLDHFIKHKPMFSEEWQNLPSNFLALLLNNFWMDPVELWTDLP